MKYFRKNIDGNWVTVKINDAQTQKIIEKQIEIAKNIKNIIDTNLAEFPQEYKNIVFQKMMPSYYDIANDLIEAILEKRTQGALMDRKELEKTLIRKLFANFDILIKKLDSLPPICFLYIIIKGYLKSYTKKGICFHKLLRQKHR